MTTLLYDTADRSLEMPPRDATRPADVDAITHDVHCPSCETFLFHIEVDTEAIRGFEASCFNCDTAIFQANMWLQNKGSNK